MNKEEKEILLSNLKTLKPFVKGTKNLTKLMGIDESTYYLWCQGRRTPKPVSLMKLAEELKISPVDLYTKKLVIETCFNFVEPENQII